MKKRIGDYTYHILIFIVCLVMVSTSMSSGLYAKYVTFDSASDSARVAKFNVTISDITAHGSNKLVTFIDSDVSAGTSYSFSISSNSEVAVSYKIVVSFSGTSAPEWLGSLLLDGKTAPTTHGANGGRYEYVFSNVGNFPAAVQSSASHTITLKTVADNLSPETDELDVGMTIRVEASQID